jgi:hypothetical protein
MNRRTLRAMVEGDIGIHMLPRRKSGKLCARQYFHLYPFRGRHNFRDLPVSLAGEDHAFLDVTRVGGDAHVRYP